MSKGFTSVQQLFRVTATNPEFELDRVLAEFAAQENYDILLVVDFPITQYWTDEKETIALTAIYRLQRGANIDSLLLSVVPTRLLATSFTPEHVASWLSDIKFPTFDLHAPIPLQPIAIPKPWGQEIWYTGIERRGVAEVGAANKKIPLPWLLQAAPTRLLGNAAEPILLKILDPLPEPVFGDLYFELHQKKQEVYVVTAVDARAWPSGEGAIRFGFDPVIRNRYSDDGAFLADYFAAVRGYRLVRVGVDGLLDDIRAREGVGLNDPLSAQTLKEWLAEIPEALHIEERELRAAMERFTLLRPLKVGDVVKVPCLLPHSLQHGVRSVEFQTPVYERLILSFAQKVLTQAEWDIDASAELLQLDPPAPEPFPVLAQDQGWIEERIVNFDNFEVRRISIEPHASTKLAIEQGYGLGIVVGGELLIGEHAFAPDQGVLLPRGLNAVLQNRGASMAYFLLALPLNSGG
ncbi:MAG: hypothetical protein JWM78_2234 [Verrucomicrobiaceae bacterium]|nr:hypothetical protein [Verrucomicrobiaceae bacterium]